MYWDLLWSIGLKIGNLNQWSRVSFFFLHPEALVALLYDFVKIQHSTPVVTRIFFTITWQENENEAKKKKSTKQLLYESPDTSANEWRALFLDTFFFHNEIFSIHLELKSIHTH